MKEELKKLREYTDRKRAEEREVNQALLAQVADHAGWKTLKETMQNMARFQVIDFADPQWQGKLTYQHAQSELVLQIIRTVEKAAEEVKKKRQEKADA